MVRYQGYIADIAGRHHYITCRAVHVFQPFEEAGMLQGDHPYQLAVYLLYDRGTQDDLASQAGIFSHLFMCQLSCQTFVHNGELVQGQGLYGIREFRYGRDA